MFFIDKQKNFPKEFRIYPPKWDTDSIIGSLKYVPDDDVVVEPVVESMGVEPVVVSADGAEPVVVSADGAEPVVPADSVESSDDSAAVVVAASADDSMAVEDVSEISADGIESADEESVADGSASDESDYDSVVVESADEVSAVVEPPVDMTESEFIDFVTDIILKVWRSNNKAEYFKSNNNNKSAIKLVKSSDINSRDIKYISKTIDSSVKPIKFIIRQNRSIISTFEDMGFSIKDHTNDKYYEGMAVEVLVFETNPDFTDEIITETIKPSIYYKDKLVSNGQVVVTIPEKTN